MADMVNVIMEDSFGGMWFGAYVVPEGALSIQTADGWQYFSTDEGLPNTASPTWMAYGNILQILFSQGCLW